MAEYIIDILTDYWFWGALGFILGAALCVRNMTRNGLPFPLAVIAITIGIYAGMIGTRLAWLAIYSPSIFIKAPHIAFAFWQETGTWLGAAISGGIGIATVLLIAKKPVFTNLGCCAPGLALAHAFARVGCLFAGCCYGKPTNVPWAVHTDYLNTMVHPTQLYSTAAELITFCILQLLWRKPASRKYLYPLYGVLLATHRFTIEFFRGDDPGPEFISGLRIYQTICIGLFVIGLSIICILKYKKRGLAYAALLIVTALAIGYSLRPKTKTSTFAAESDAAPVYLVATRTSLAPGLDDWKKLRAKDGFSIVLKEWAQQPIAADVRNWISSQMKEKGRIDYILIVGDCLPEEKQNAPWHIPSAQLTYGLSGQKAQCLSDALFGDIDGDLVPDVPVGRFPVRDKIQTQMLADKTIRYRLQANQLKPIWFRAVLWAGAKGYNKGITDATDALLQITPKWLTPFIISGDTNSVYAGYPPEQPQLFLENLHTPGMLNIIASHGSYRSVTPTHYDGNDIFLAAEDAAQINKNSLSGLLMVISCDAGKFNTTDAQGPSFAEAFINAPGGPISVVASGQTTDALTNYLLAKEITLALNEFPPTTGQLWLNVQRNISLAGSATFAKLAHTDHVTTEIVKRMPQQEKYKLTTPALAKYQALSYNLLGDPACNLRMPKNLPLLILAEKRDRVRISGGAQEKCEKLYAELISTRPNRKNLPQDADPQLRRNIWHQMNPVPQTLLVTEPNSQPIDTQFDVPTDYFDSDDYLRFTGIRDGRVFISMHGAFGKAPFIDPNQPPTQQPQ